MSTPDPYYVLVPRSAVRALVGPATIQEQGRAREELKAALAQSYLDLMEVLGQRLESAQVRDPGGVTVLALEVLSLLPDAQEVPR